MTPTADYEIASPLDWKGESLIYEFHVPSTGAVLQIDIDNLHRFYDLLLEIKAKLTHVIRDNYIHEPKGPLRLKGRHF